MESVKMREFLSFINHGLHGFSQMDKNALL